MQKEHFKLVSKLNILALLTSSRSSVSTVRLCLVKFFDHQSKYFQLKLHLSFKPLLSFKPNDKFAALCVCVCVCDSSATQGKSDGPVLAGFDRHFNGRLVNWVGLQLNARKKSRLPVFCGRILIVWPSLLPDCSICGWCDHWQFKSPFRVQETVCVDIVL